MLTHSVAVEDIGSNSVWQDGPEFLKAPVDSWPVHQNYLTEVLDTLCHTLTSDNAFLYDRHNSTVSQIDLNVIHLQRFVVTQSYSEVPVD